MKYTVYIASGEILWTGECPDNDYQAQASGDQLLLPIESNGATQYVENGQLVDMPVKPIGAYLFNYATKTWVAQTDSQVQSVASQRNKLLYESDWTQIPNNPLTTEQQATWATYRQELRDVPQQSGYPYNVVWPVAPS
jgi:hypothetical protein